MDRRIFISTLMSLPFSATARAALPWKAEFVVGGFDGKTYAAGFRVIMDKDWKTYWRNPGTAGIPPYIEITGGNLASVTIDFPLPKRIIEESGEALGYHDEVIFPLTLKPIDATKPVAAHLSSFFGICAVVCTPAKFEADGKFALDNPQQFLITKWQMRVPQPAQFITATHLVDKFLVLELNQPIIDLFVEGPDNLYFRAPDFSKEAGKAWIKVERLKDTKDLLGIDLRITADANGQGLEQHVVVA